MSLTHANVAPALLELRGLTIGLPQQSDRPDAVSSLDLTVQRGEIVCLVGESGSGKSSIALAIMGLLPTGLTLRNGQILLDGQDLVPLPATALRAVRAQRMAMIFQEPMSALNPVMRCGAQLDEVLREHTLLDLAARSKKMHAILHEVGFTDTEQIIAAYPHQLSGGQRQRIMIAMALVLEPALLIADEPTTALDVTTQAQILQLIASLQQRRGMGVLFITHDFGIVAEIAHRVLVLHAGQCVESGTRTAVLQQPQQAYTQQLIRAVPTLIARASRVDPNAELVLRVQDLSKTYDAPGWFSRRKATQALHQISLEIRRGQTLGIVGESGSGKSTLARCVARLIEPTQGNIFLGGDDIAHRAATSLRPLRRRVQIVFQDPYRSLNPRMTVGEALIEGPLNYGVSRNEALQNAARLLTLVQLEPAVMSRYPHQFSGGQRQRLCIARGLALAPDLLIADEAVSALDVSVQAQVLALLEDIRAKLQLAMLFITHDLRVAAQLCHHVAVMSHGEIVEHGPATEIFSHPQHPYTQTLLAAAPGRHFAFAQ